MNAPFGCMLIALALAAPLSADLGGITTTPINIPAQPFGIVVGSDKKRLFKNGVVIHAARIPQNVAGDSSVIESGINVAHVFKLRPRPRRHRHGQIRERAGVDKFDTEK